MGRGFAIQSAPGSVYLADLLPPPPPQRRLGTGERRRLDIQRDRRTVIKPRRRWGRRLWWRRRLWRRWTGRRHSDDAPPAVPSRLQTPSHYRHRPPSPQPSHYFTLGTKVGNTLHTQIRLGMSKLNTHQYSIQKTASPSCACGYKQENTKHFIIHCPRFASARSELFSQVSTHLNTDFRTLSDDTKIDTLLNGHNTTKHTAHPVSTAFQKFLQNTSRL